MEECSIVTGIEALRTLADVSGGGALPTQDPAWIQTCAEVLVDPGDLVVASAGAVVTAWVRRESLVSRFEPIGARELGEPWSLDGDAESLGAIARGLSTTGLPALFPRVAAESPWLSALEKVFGRRLLTREVGGAPFVSVSRKADPIPSASLRADLRRARRRAEARGAVHAEILSPTPRTHGPIWDELVRVEAAGWKGRAGSALAKDRMRSWFFRTWAHRAAASGTLRVARLSVGGAVAAVELACVHANRYWLVKIGYDEAFAGCSPGMLLLEHVVRSCAEEGLDAVELLGSVEPWTARWTAEARACVSVRAYAASAIGMAAFGQDAAAFVWGRVRA